MISDSNENSAQACAKQPAKAKAEPGKKAKTVKTAKPAKAPKPKADRTNKKAE